VALAAAASIATSVAEHFLEDSDRFSTVLTPEHPTLALAVAAEASKAALGEAAGPSSFESELAISTTSTVPDRAPADTRARVVISDVSDGVKLSRAKDGGNFEELGAAVDETLPVAVAFGPRYFFTQEPAFKRCASAGACKETFVVRLELVGSAPAQVVLDARAFIPWGTHPPPDSAKLKVTITEQTP
jgi:hypothetical protein